MRPLKRIGGSLVVLLALGSFPARAEEILRGPHPFLKDNELSLHGLYGAGFNDTFRGAKVALDYGYRLNGSVWLDLGGGLLSGTCRPRQGEPACGVRKGDMAEVLAGIKYKFQMNVPVVPYAKMVIGVAYLFPDQADGAAGPIARVGGGAKYFFYDWLGVGLEATWGLGRAGYDDGAGLSRTVAALDVGLGIETQF